MSTPLYGGGGSFQLQFLEVFKLIFMQNQIKIQNNRYVLLQKTLQARDFSVLQQFLKHFKGHIYFNQF